MITIACLENRIYRDGSHFSHLVIQPINLRQSITIGSALRRALLIDLYGSAIKGVRINNLQSEFTQIPGIKEDTLEILMNLKQIIIKKNFHENFMKKPISGFLNVRGPLIVTSNMFQLPKEKVQIVNLNEYICSILTPTELYLEIDIDTNKGYQKIEYQERYIRRKKFIKDKGSTLLIDALFNPIKLANYKTNLIYDSKGNAKEVLHFEILTNGVMTPYRAFLESLKILLDLLFPILTHSTFLKLNSIFLGLFKPTF